MVKQGQKEILQTDDALERTQKIVEDTIQVSSARALPLTKFLPSQAALSSTHLCRTG